VKTWIIYFVVGPLAIIALVVWLFGFGGYDQWRYGAHYIESSTAFWQEVVARELPLGSSGTRIREWAQGRSLEVYAAPDGKALEIVVQTIPWHQVVCREWKIIAEITMDKDASAGERVVSMGACL
jgi:hypothetical protein